MKILIKMKFAVLLLVFIPLAVLTITLFTPPPKAYAATSPSLGQADGFAVLANTSITDVPTSAITGNVGLSAGASITGLKCSEVTGTIYDGDGGYTGNGGGTACLVTNAGLVTQAKTDLVSAYNALSAADNAACTVDYGSVTKDLVGLSLVPGVYCAEGGSGAFTLSGTLTLSGSGVWIFRSGSTLVTSGTANVVGGDPCNVWWKVPSSATIASSTSLKGNILASTSIGMVTGASLNGRALAQTGAVTLQSNTITKPTCAASSSSSSSGSSSTVCPTNFNNIAPTILESRRVDANSIFIRWGSYAGIDTFNVRYGFENGKWLYSTNVTGFSTTINGLPANQPIWIQVAARNNCSIGAYGVAMLVGGPRLPNTGFAPNKNNNPWYILGSIVMLVSTPLVVVLRKRRV